MEEKQKETINLNQILIELEDILHYEHNALYKRFQKIRPIVVDDAEELKDKNEILFDIEEKPFVMGLIDEMGYPYLPKFIRRQTGGIKKVKGVTVELEEARDFYDRMMVWIDKVNDKELKKMMIGSIDMISRKDAWSKTSVITDKIRNIGDLIHSQELTHDEYDRILNEISLALDMYYSKLEHYFKKEKSKDKK